jgi:hypothetical protein
MYKYLSIKFHGERDKLLDFLGGKGFNLEHKVVSGNEVIVKILDEFAENITYLRGLQFGNSERNRINEVFIKLEYRLLIQTVFLALQEIVTK